MIDQCVGLCRVEVAHVGIFEEGEELGGVFPLGIIDYRFESATEHEQTDSCGLIGNLSPNLMMDGPAGIPKVDIRSVGETTNEIVPRFCETATYSALRGGDEDFDVASTNVEIFNRLGEALFFQKIDELSHLIFMLAGPMIFS